MAKKTTKNIILICLLLGVGLGCGCDKGPVSDAPPLIAMLKTKKVLTPNEIAELKIINTSNKKYYYCVGLESNYKEKWAEYVPDTDSDYHGGIGIREILPKQIKFHRWPSKWTDEIEKPYLRSFLHLRFRISYFEKSPNDLEYESLPKIYSDEFEFRGGEFPNDIEAESFIFGAIVELERKDEEKYKKLLSEKYIKSYKKDFKTLNEICKFPNVSDIATRKYKSNGNITIAILEFTSGVRLEFLLVKKNRILFIDDIKIQKVQK
jgi:hypothetical protein